MKLGQFFHLILAAGAWANDQDVVDEEKVCLNAGAMLTQCIKTTKEGADDYGLCEGCILMQAPILVTKESVCDAVCDTIQTCSKFCHSTCEQYVYDLVNCDVKLLGYEIAEGCTGCEKKTPKKPCSECGRWDARCKLNCLKAPEEPVPKPVPTIERPRLAYKPVPTPADSCTCWKWEFDVECKKRCGLFTPAKCSTCVEGDAKCKLNCEKDVIKCSTCVEGDAKCKLNCEKAVM